MQALDYSFHPFLIHLPLVLPFILIYHLLRLDLSIVANNSYYDLIFISIVQLIATVKAYYSGLFRADTIHSELSEAKIKILELHSASGRIFLWLATISLLLIILLKISHNKRYRLRAFCLITVSLMALLAIGSGYTGGYLTHG